MTPQLVLRQRSGPIITIIVWAFLGYLLVDSAVRGSWHTVWSYLPSLLLIGWFVYLLLWRPAVIVGNDDVIIRELLRTTRVPFTRITDIRLSAIVAISAEDPAGRQRVYRPWNAPGRARRRADSGLTGGMSPDPLDRHPSFELLRRWEQQALAPRPDSQPATVTTWNTGVLTATIVLIVLVIIGLL